MKGRRRTTIVIRRPSPIVVRRRRPSSVIIRRRRPAVADVSNHLSGLRDFDHQYVGFWRQPKPEKRGSYRDLGFDFRAADRRVAQCRWHGRPPLGHDRRRLTLLNRDGSDDRRADQGNDQRRIVP